MAGLQKQAGFFCGFPEGFVVLIEKSSVKRQQLSNNLYLCGRNTYFSEIQEWSRNHRATGYQSDMMTESLNEVSLRHDTTMCGDPKIWVS